MESFITETGSKILDSKMEELSYKSQKLQPLYQTGNQTQMQSYLDGNRRWMPMMLLSGLINMIMFASMMSFIGMDMNAAESSQTEGQVDSSGGADATGGEGGDSTDTSDIGGTDTGSYIEMDYSGASGSGTDLRVFDSF